MSPSVIATISLAAFCYLFLFPYAVLIQHRGTVFSDKTGVNWLTYLSIVVWLWSIRNLYYYVRISIKITNFEINRRRTSLILEAKARVNRSVLFFVEMCKPDASEASLQAAVCN